MADEEHPKRDRRSEFTTRRAREEEADMRDRYARDKEDANRQSIGNVRGEAMLMRQEMRADLEKVSDASRERDKELHQKLDQRNEKFDDRLDKLKDDVTKLSSEVETFNKIMGDKDKGEFDDVPYYYRPSYIKAMGMALAAVLGAIIVSWGLVKVAGPPPHDDPPAADAPAEPGDSEGD